MRRLILFILALAALLPSLAFGYDILLLQSSREPAYGEVLKGFRLEQKTSVRTLVLADYAEMDVVRIVREDQPHMILAVGDDALKKVRTIRNTPVLAVMALGINTAHAVQPNLTGISMFTAPEGYIDLFRNMRIRRVGVLCNRARSGWYLNQARLTARQAGIELVVREVSSPRETPAELSGLAGKVDALWMLPDTTAVTRETAEAYFRFGQENAVPVISFADSYIGLGASAVFDADLRSLGHQADELASRILNGEIVEAPVFPKSATIRVNQNVLHRLGLKCEKPEMTCAIKPENR